MKIVTTEQHSPEWYAARTGVPSASNFDLIIQLDGKRSKQRDKYLWRLAGQVVTGLGEESYKNEAMERGLMLEAEAREMYQFITGETVQQVGFCVSEGPHIYGASPDGLVGEDGLLEIKCPLIATHISYLLNGGLEKEYFQQVQGQLLVTGRKWCDLMSYYPGLKPLIVRVLPDIAFHASLKTELEQLCDELKTVVDKIR